MSLAQLSDDQLRTTLCCLADTDRARLIELVDHLGEVDARQLHLRWGFRSLWDYCGRELRLKDGVAHLRFCLARLVRTKPQLRILLVEGRLGACAACLLADFVGEADFDDLVQRAIGLSKRELQELLEQRRPRVTAGRDVIRRVAAKVDPKTATLVYPQVVDEAAVSPATLASLVPMALALPQAAPQAASIKTHRISFNATAEVVEQLRRLQDLLGVSEVGDVVAKACQLLLDKKAPERRAARRIQRATKSQSAAKPRREPSTRHPRRPSARDADDIKLRDQECCSFVARDGTRCMARRHLQIDHVEPWAVGGATTSTNLRTLCRGHNLLFARDSFGNKVPGPRASTG
jgi:hypothetical protein